MLKKMLKKKNGEIVNSSSSENSGKNNSLGN